MCTDNYENQQIFEKINSMKNSHKKPLEQLGIEEIGQLEIQKQFFQVYNLDTEKHISYSNANISQDQRKMIP